MAALTGLQQLIAQGGVTTLLCSALVWVFAQTLRGKIVSGRTLERELAAEQRRVDDANRRADEWKAAHDAQAAVSQVQAGQLPRILDVLETMDRFVRTQHVLPPVPVPAPTPAGDGHGMGGPA